jgi:hypothetical protein
MELAAEEKEKMEKKKIGKLQQEVQATVLNPDYYNPSSSDSGGGIAAPQSQLTLLDLIDRILDKGIVINGDITIAIAGTDLLTLKINLVIASLETAKRYGVELPWEKWNSSQDDDQYELRNQRVNNRQKISRRSVVPSNGKKSPRKAMLAEARNR